MSDLHVARRHIRQTSLSLTISLICVNLLVGQTTKDRSRELFNGRDLTGWYSWLHDSQYDDPRSVFSVQDGQLHISGDGLGYLATRESFANYHLIVEYRWGARNYPPREGKARDAGLFLHCIGADGNSIDGQGAFRSGIECQIMEGATGDLMLIRGREPNGADYPLQLRTRSGPQADAEGWPWYSPSGASFQIETWGRVNWLAKSHRWADQFGFRGQADRERRVGEWNRLECICQNAGLEIRLNGQPINRAEAVWPRRGPILLQCERSEIWFRRVTVVDCSTANR